MREVWVVLEKTYSDRALEDVALVGVYDDEVQVSVLLGERVSGYMRANKGKGMKVVYTCPKEGEKVATLSGPDDAPLVVLVISTRTLNRTAE